ncbi:helix-turn-helix domain-containing protein [Sediminibacter sp. Hel_I_10]|uniref:helix-turn-helix domain-containing protein n=1 Tax=Sediminibacter sp. Hel_I_10 TaxID=1392490 RepID=UPI00068BE214|nr:helix-turn-helix transcriptional regulator [Sediminibacter sp. Hel_I_10]
MNQIENQEFLISFGQNLRRLRKSKGFTQADLANDIGIEISQISRIERGVINTSILTIKQISSVLDVDINMFFNLNQK